MTTHIVLKIRVIRGEIFLTRLSALIRGKENIKGRQDFSSRPITKSLLRLFSGHRHRHPRAEQTLPHEELLRPEQRGGSQTFPAVRFRCACRCSWAAQWSAVDRSLSSACWDQRLHQGCC